MAVLDVDAPGTRPATRRECLASSEADARDGLGHVRCCEAPDGASQPSPAGFCFRMMLACRLMSSPHCLMSWLKASK